MKINYICDKLSNERRYPCSLKQIKKVISELPARYTSGIKQIRFSNRRKFRGPAVTYEESGEIIFFSYSKHLCLTWCRRKPTVSRISRIDRELLEWGGVFMRYGDYWWLRWRPKDLANYTLHHILLHEIGHLYGYGKGLRKGKIEEYAEEFANQLGRKHRVRIFKMGIFRRNKVPV